MPLSALFSPSLTGIAQRLGLEPPHKDRPAWSYGTEYGRQGAVDARLTGILSEAAERFARENPGYTVEATSGKKGRSSGTRWHPGGIATDVQITDPTGKKLGNYQDAKSFRTYEKFAQTARAVQQETYPELNGNFAWGGYFGGRYAADQMHFDLGPTRGSLGSWEGGLNDRGRAFLRGAKSIGLGPMFAARESVPTPTARPPSPSDLANIASLNSIHDRREFERPAFAAPRGRVERSPLADLIQDRREYERPSFAAPLGRVDRTALPDIPKSSPSARIAFDAAAAGAPQSLPPDRPMPSGPINASTQFAPPTSLPPDRPMPSGPVRQSLPDIAGLQAMQDQREYERPGLSHLLSPEPMSPTLAPALSPPTEVADYSVADVISPIPDAPASPTVSPTVEGAFPAAPEISTWDKVKYTGKPIARDAMLGLQLAGPLGALGVAGIGALGRQLGIGNRPGFDSAVPDRFSTGFGLKGITSAMGGPKGAQGFSLSNPGMSFTSLGPGMGGLRRSDKYGWTEVVDASGAVRGIKYDKPETKGLFGKISKSMNDKFGGGISDKERAEFSGRVGLY